MDPLESTALETMSKEEKSIVSIGLGDRTGQLLLSVVQSGFEIFRRSSQ